MTVFFSILEAVILTLGIGLLGFFLVSRKVMPGNVLSLLLPLTLDIALPCLIFFNILTKFNPSNNPEWWQLPIWWAGFTSFIFLLTALSGFISARKTRREFMLSLFYQNALFFPLAIISRLFPGSPEYLVQLFLFNLFFSAFFFNTYQFFFKSRTRLFNWKRLLNPPLIATALAVLIRISGVEWIIPDVVISITDMMGRITLPLILLIIGGSIYLDFQKIENIKYLEILKFVLLKNFAFPLAAIGILHLLRPPYALGLLLLLQSTVPPITSAPLVTERSGGDRAVCNQFLLASFIASVISIPLMVALASCLINQS